MSSEAQWWLCSWSPGNGYDATTTDGEHSNNEFVWGLEAYDNKIGYVYCRMEHVGKPAFAVFQGIISKLTTAKMEEDKPQYWTYTYRANEAKWTPASTTVISVWYASHADFVITVYGTEANRGEKVDKILKTLWKIQKGDE